jgi:hypothetical protein
MRTMVRVAERNSHIDLANSQAVGFSSFSQSSWHFSFPTLGQSSRVFFAHLSQAFLFFAVLHPMAQS